MSAAGPLRRPPAGVIVVTLALLLGVQPVTTDLYLPALPLIASNLQAPMGAVQLTLSAVLLCFGLGQLVAGPWADRLGRRPVLLGGLALYTAAGVGGAMAENVAALVVWRAMQGLGMACAVVCARAMVRDLYAPHEGARVMSQGLSGLGLLAMASPAIGGALAAAWGWRAAVVAPSAFGVICLAWVALRTPETLAKRNRAATHLGPMLQTYRRMAAHPTFVAWTALITCTYAGLYVFLATSAFVLTEVMGVSRAMSGVFIATNSMAYLLGTVWCRRWLARHGPAGTVQRGAWFTLAGGLTMAGGALAGVGHPLAVLAPQWLFAFGHGVHQPCGQSGTAGPFPAHAGAASALSGFVLAAGAFATGAWLGQVMDGTALPPALTHAAMASLTALVAWTLVRRHGDLPEAAPARPAGALP